MLSLISNNVADSIQAQTAAASKPAVSGSAQQASLKPDTVSISSQGRVAAADVNRDGDSH